MRVLLDTHAFLWTAADAPELGREARRCWLDPATCPLLSVASVWEMAIKAGLGKLRLDMPLDELVAQGIEGQGIALLPIDLSHALAVRTLPLHHRDPFDRLLAAQALAEKVPILSADDTFDRYGVKRIW
ncbi:MAG: type II toxin-antitoxin system VapC family toxin [Deltaproteobacteria bacterium]|nr:type II toxin-antitoxin system VapC family toxin [Deltaproteobacteria bacterium]